MRRRLWVLSFMVSIFTASALSDTIYVQASRGSFNDAAIHKLFKQQPHLTAKIQFSGTPTNAFKLAAEQNALAFVAVMNSTIDGNLVQATVDAMKLYEVQQIKGLITTRVEMCALMHQKDVAQKIAIQLIASHPAALKQINGWKITTHAKELAIPEGTAIAAEKVSTRVLPEGTAAIGACVLTTTYPNLAVVAQGVEDNKDNRTSFILAQVKKRATPLNEEQARQALKAVIYHDMNSEIH